MLNKTHRLAMDYNIALEQALVASEAAFASWIKAAIARVTQSEAFQQWNKEHPDAFTLSTSSSLPNDWFIRIRDALATPAPSPTEGVWAIWWLRAAPVGYYRPTTLGWLLAGNRDQTVHAIYSVLSSPSGGYPPPPFEWLHEIVDEAWPTLESHPTYLTVRTLHEELFTQVSQAETKLVDKLHYIQNTYEGGPPPL